MWEPGTKLKSEPRHCQYIAQQVIEAITAAANTGKIGDGKIFLTSVEQAVRIRTGETGDEAL